MILVTGTSGALGSLILQRLWAAVGSDAVAGTRAATGAGARQIDFDRPGTLAAGFRGVDVLVFVSAGYAEDDVVLARHGAVISAAASAGVRHVIYTSLAGSADRLTIALAHRWTEERLAEASFDVTVLRNGLYVEVPVGLALMGAESAAASGVFSSPWGEGRVPVVAREDLADVAARVALESHQDLLARGRSRHAGRTYELDGVDTISGADIAAMLAEASGTAVRYETAPLRDARAALAAAGLEAYQVAHTISMLANINAGFLDPHRPSELPALLGAPPRPVQQLASRAVREGSFRSRSVATGP
jgi:uncharacterized protein YbjT (DUF2867 family)